MGEWLLRCQAADPDQARKGRWLNWLLLIFIALQTLLTLPVFFSPDLQVQFMAVDVFLLGALLVLYYLNRRGFVTFTAATLVVAMALAILAAALFTNTDQALALIYPTLLFGVIAAAGVFLTWRAVATAVVTLSGITLWYYSFSSLTALVEYRRTSPDGATSLTVIVIMSLAGVGALSWLSSRLIQQALEDIRRRNAELAAANRELAAQIQQDHRLGQNIAGLTGRLTAISTRQVGGVAAQARSIGQVVSAVTELHDTADQIAALAQEVREAADIADTSVQRAQDMVLRSRDAVQRNRSQVEEVIERMSALEQLTARITGFINRIRDLSDETQLLALNATIEAAGAGALGRRFGVVATEVQHLSNRATEIVDQIRSLIGELERAGHATAAATQNSIAVANEVERLADDVRRAQEQVVDAVQRTRELVHLISSATAQQTYATQHMTQTMQEIAQVSDATSEDAGVLDRAIGELQQAADLLNSAMQQLGAAAGGAPPAVLPAPPGEPSPQSPSGSGITVLRPVAPDA